MTMHPITKQLRLECTSTKTSAAVEVYVTSADFPKRNSTIHSAKMRKSQESLAETQGHCSGKHTWDLAQKIPASATLRGYYHRLFLRFLRAPNSGKSPVSSPGFPLDTKPACVTALRLACSQLPHFFFKKQEASLTAQALGLGFRYLKPRCTCPPYRGFT